MTSLPTTSAAISADWLNDVLGDEVRGNARITGVAATVIGEGVGMLGEVARLELSYDQPTAQSVTSMISKMPTSNEGFRFVATMMGLYEKEEGFYRDIAPEIRVRIPTCYANLRDEDAFVLLLEDLAPMRPGNQLASCSLVEARMALTEVAKLHARWWKSERLADYEAWLPGPTSPMMQVFKGGYLAGLEAFHAEWGHMVSAECNELIDRIAANYEGMVLAGPGREPHTLIHGDFRLDNMMFDDSSEPPAMAILDWQLPFRSNPMWDVVYLLAGNFEPAWRVEHQDGLLADYHQALVAGGVSDYSFDQCAEDYRAAALVLPGYLVTMAADVDVETLDDRGRALVEMLITRYGEAVDDLGAGEFMPS